MPQSVFWKDQHLNYLGCNQRFAADAGQPSPESMIGKSDYELGWAAQADLYRADDQRVIDTQVTLHNYEEPQTTPEGATIWLRTSKVPLHDVDGTVIGVFGMYEDITAQKRSLTEHNRLQEEIIQLQAAALAELSTPLIPINNDIVVMPLIGTIDSQRSQQIINSLLSGVAQSTAQYAIIDITGVSVVDTQVANVLIRAAQAVQLLGASVMLTGIRPEVAQTLVGLGVDMTGIITQGTLQSGIALAMRQRAVLAR